MLSFPSDKRADGRLYRRLRGRHKQIDSPCGGDGQLLTFLLLQLSQHLCIPEFMAIKHLYLKVQVQQQWPHLTFVKGAQSASRWPPMEEHELHHASRGNYQLLQTF